MTDKQFKELEENQNQLQNNQIYLFYAIVTFGIFNVIVTILVRVLI